VTPILTAAPPAPARNRRSLAVAAVAATIAAAALFYLLGPFLRVPHAVDSVTVSNPYRWHSEVDVGPPDGSRWVGLGRVSRESSRTFADVIDPGDQWVFRFAYSGIDSVELAISRSELEAAGWKVTVPDDFSERLETIGETPSAPGE